MAKPRNIEPGNAAVVDHFTTSHQKMAQINCAGAGHRAEQWIMQAEIAGVRKIEDRDIGEFSGREHASFLKAEHAGAAGACPAHYLLDAHRRRSLRRAMGMPSAVLLADHV